MVATPKFDVLTSLVFLILAVLFLSVIVPDIATDLLSMLERLIPILIIIVIVTILFGRKRRP